MSQNKKQDDLFDTWLRDSLQTAHVAHPAFAQKLVRRMQQHLAQRMLHKVLLQKRIAGGMLILSVITVIGLLCSPAILCRIYAFLESALAALIRCCIEPQTISWPILTAGLLVFCLLLQLLWKNLTSDN